MTIRVTLARREPAVSRRARHAWPWRWLRGGAARARRAVATPVAAEPRWRRAASCRRSPSAAGQTARRRSRSRRAGPHGRRAAHLMGRSKDIRLMVVYGYARLVGYDTDFEIWCRTSSRSVDVEDGPHLHACICARPPLVGRRAVHRRGLPLLVGGRRQQRGAVAVRAAGLLLVDGEPPKVEVIDETTVRYTWSKAQPLLPARAGRRAPLYIYRAGALPEAVPRRYADADELKKMVKKRRRAQLGGAAQRARQHVQEQQPGAADAAALDQHDAAASQRFVFERNPTSTASTRTASSCPTSTGSS